MKKGKFIVIDGTDGSGKATQVKLLAERLKKEGKKVEIVDFPEYYDNFFGSGSDGPFAKLIRRCFLYVSPRQIIPS
jgi:thymidylate kinase